jgi:hypothetical protein
VQYKLPFYPDIYFDEGYIVAFAYLPSYDALIINAARGILIPHAQTIAELSTLYSWNLE